MNTRYQLIFFSTVFILTMLLAVLIFWPYLISLAITGMFAVILYPVYEWCNKYIKSNNTSAALMVIALIVLIGLPVVFLGNQIINEAEDVYTSIEV